MSDDFKNENSDIGLDDFSDAIDDNFEDELSFEGDIDNDNTDNFENFDDVDYSPVTNKGDVNWFNIGIIGAAIIGVGGLTYAFLPKLMGSTTPTAQTQIEQPVQTADIVEEEISFFDNPELLNDIGTLNKTTQENDTAEIFEAIDAIPSISDEEMDSLFAAIPQTEANTPTPPQESINSIDQVIDTLPMPSDANPISTEASDELIVIEQPNVVAPIISDAANNKIDALNTRINSMNDTMESFMNRLDEKLETMSRSSQQVTTIDNSDQLNQLQKTLSRLENRMTAVEKKPKIVKAPVPVVTMTETPKPVVIIQEKAPDVLLPTPAPIKTVEPKKRPEPAYLPPKMQYELRGASNGQAVIAQKGTQNLQTVTVGSIVRGLGQINSITQESGSWVVRGTAGLVRQ